MSKLREFNIGCKREGVIYSIINTINSKVYIGSTDLFFKRKSSHICLLEQNKHHSIHLQRAYNKYGENAFEFDILQRAIRQGDLLFFEQNWINLTQSSFGKYGYNQLPNAEGTRGRKVSKEERAMRSIAAKKIFGTSEARKKRSDYNKSVGRKLTVNFYDKRKDEFTFPSQKLQVKQVKEIIDMFNQKIPRKVIMAKFNISRGHVTLIGSGKAWKCLNNK